MKPSGDKSFMCQNFKAGALAVGASTAFLKLDPGDLIEPITHMLQLF